MKKSFKWVIGALALLGVIIWATVLYNEYSDDYVPLTDFTQSPSQGEEPSSKAPDFTVLDYNGKEVSLSQYKGEVVVLNFWATWCYYCKEEMPDFELAFKENPDVQFLMVNATDGYQETMAQAKKYYEDSGFSFPVYFDTNMDAVNAYGITGFPTTVIIDKEGNVANYFGGMIDKETLQKAIDEVK